MAQNKLPLFTIFFILALALFSISASAYESYQLSAPFSPVTVASCASSTEILTLRNAGDEAAHISLTFVDKDVNEFANIVPSQFFMTPGESKTVTIFINAPCETQGNFDYAISLQGNSINQIFDRQIMINKVSNVDFIATKGNVLNSCPCIPQTIPFTITNTGSWAESYTVSAIGHEANVAVPQGELFLAPGQTFSGAAFVSFSCSTYGTKDFKLQVESTNSKFKATMPVTYNIAACYDYTLGIDNNVTVCEQDTAQVVAVVNNTAAYTNTFDLESSVPKFSTESGNQVTLTSGQIGIAPITFAPNKGDAGQYTYTVEATSRLGNLFATQSGNLNVQRCYEYNIATPQDQEKYSVCAPGEQLTFEITNNGELTQEMHVNSSDARFTSTPSVFNLTAGTSKSVTLSVPSSGIEKKMNFDLQVWATNNPSVVAAKQITLQPYDLQTCFGVEVSPEVFVINNSKTNLSVKITNEGIRNTVYNVTIAGPQWAKLLNNTIYIPARESRYITLQTSAPIFVDNTTYVANFSVETPYTQQNEQIKLILNAETSKWLLWFLLILLLLLVALLIILLVARRARKTIGQPTAVVAPVEKSVVKAKALTPVAPKKLTAAQKRALRNERARNRRQAASNKFGWRRVLFIILIVAILLAFLFSFVAKNHDSNNNAVTNTPNVSNASNISHPSNGTSVNTTNGSITGSGGIQTNTTSTNNISSNTSSNTSHPTNPTSNITINGTNVTGNFTTGLNTTNDTNSSNGSHSFWQSVKAFFASFNIFGGSDNNAGNNNQTTVVNATNITNTTNVTTTNVTNTTTPTVNVTANQTTQSNSSTNSSTNQSANQTNQPTVDPRAVQRANELAAARELLANAQAAHSNRVFVLAQNTSGKLNLSQYFIDPDNLSLTYEFQAVNASRTTAFINGDMLFLEPNTNFVGVQTFRIVATNQVNLSTTSPLFTLVVLDELPRQPISQSIQLGLLILLIVIALIVYFDIRLIAKQYEHAKTVQNAKKKNK